MSPRVCIIIATTLLLQLIPSSHSTAQLTKETGHKLAVTISPFLLLGPMVELTGEFRQSEKVSVAGIIGYGSISSISVFDIGGQVNYYLIGGFDHGMQLGAELNYLHLNGDFDNSVTVAGNGLSIGPYIGYKVAADFGLTFNVQGGLAFITATATGKDQSGTQTGAAAGLGLIFNLNLGWSF